VLQLDFLQFKIIVVVRSACIIEGHGKSDNDVIRSTNFLT
jgi:hypothetical protein